LQSSDYGSLAQRESADFFVNAWSSFSASGPSGPKFRFQVLAHRDMATGCNVTLLVYSHPPAKVASSPRPKKLKKLRGFQFCGVLILEH
jgi:hypothetical protein